MTEKSKQTIEDTRAKIKAMQNDIDEIYKNMCAEVSSEIDDEIEPWLFDYVFNCDESTVDSYFKMVQQKIYGE